MLQQAIVAPAADHRLAIAAARILHLEDEAGIVVEIAREGRRKGEGADVEAACRHKAGPFLEQVEGGSHVEPRVRGKRAHCDDGRVGIAGNGEVALDHLARVFVEARPVRGPCQKAFGDLAGAASANARDPRNRQNVLDEGFGGLGRLTLDRRGSTGQSIRMPATMTIAADGRHSAVARALGLASHPLRPRRWAFGVYATGIEALTDLGEMHVRPRYYLGIAPLSRGVSNVCVVTGPRPEGRSPIEIVRKVIAAEPALAQRFARVQFVSQVRVLGPLAVNARAPGVDGLLLAGDAAGFVDPMTGDGLSLAMRSAELAAAEAFRTLETGDFAGAVMRLAATRHQAFGSKLRFNRLVRRLVDSPAALEIAGLGATIAPGLVERAVRYAGDAA